MLCHQAILPGKITFGKTQIMNGIQQISFAFAVLSANANNSFAKCKLLAEVIFELGERYRGNI